jgi:hypothetical protein
VSGIVYRVSQFGPLVLAAVALVLAVRGAL